MERFSISGGVASLIFTRQLSAPDRPNFNQFTVTQTVPLILIRI